MKTVIAYSGEKRWIYSDEFDTVRGGDKDVLDRVIKIFCKENVMFYDGGIPQVFSSNGDIPDVEGVKSLLNWDCRN